MDILTMRNPMRLMGFLVVVCLVSVTVLYFYDTVIAGFARLKWHGKLLVTPAQAKLFSVLMAVIIGFGVLAESAETIWNKFMYWGQVIDNKIITLFSGKKYFIDAAQELLDKTRLMFNQTNFRLQMIAIPTEDWVVEKADFEKLCHKVKMIKNNCQKINAMLEINQAKDPIHLQKQEVAKQILNNLVSANLDMSAQVDKLNEKFN